MYLSLSKRFELSTSHQIRVAAWPDERNESYFGRESQGQFGHGHNFVAYFVFHGPVVDDNGMMINVSIIKERIKRAIYPRYDHRYLNQDTPPFDRLIPTPENIASELLRESRQLFEGESAEPVVCHLEESPWSAATAYADGRVERHLQTD
ncbi:MAG TPA: 6-carboxytetrahydropterin synthase, partial [candidate division Zixibacteria bacterium]|nr:6-carboxytetrahydropterin synthase [candidate division Zixibacteria bacterium]